MIMRTYPNTGRRFFFDGRSCMEFGMIAGGEVSYGVAERDLEWISIAGRNGDLIKDNKRFKNIPVNYPVTVIRDFLRNSEAASAWLLGKSGYRRLSDGYRPDTFRLASFAGPIDFVPLLINRMGQATLTFNCKPQRYLFSGEIPIIFTVPGELYNDHFPALPLIKVIGAGDSTLTIGGTLVQIYGQTEPIFLDCDLQNAYRETAEGIKENRNNQISAPVFPVLHPGTNVVTWTGGITSLEITPRWWTL